MSGNIPATGAAALTPHWTIVRPGHLARPRLTWEPLAGADHYQVWVGPALGSVDPGEQGRVPEGPSYPAMTDTGTWFLPGAYDGSCRPTPRTDLPSAPVRPHASPSRSSAGPGQRSPSTVSPSTTGLRCTARIGGTPDICDKVPTTPVFSWYPVQGAAFYILYISEDASFTNLVEPTHPATSNTRYAPMSTTTRRIPESQAGGVLLVVRPCRAVGVCARPGLLQRHGDQRVPQGVAQGRHRTLPVVGGLRVTTSEVTFDWNDYFDTNRATTWTPTGERVPSPRCSTASR